MKILIFALMVSLFAVNAANTPYVNNRAERLSPAVSAVSRTLPSVVNLSTERLLETDQQEAETKPFFDKRRGYSLGSGCIITKDGLVITSAHVVLNALKIKATFHDGRTVAADIIAADELNDLALLQLHGAPSEYYRPIPLAAPGDLILGETVIAVGNPYGLGSTISQGVLSAIGRQVTFRDQVVFSDILQTDTSIHPGNSGGPLININGEMIGITLATMRGVDGISFAIPVQRIENVLAHWITPERLNNTSIGIIPEVKRQQNGELIFSVADVLNGSPALNAGVKPGQRILRLNNAMVYKIGDLVGGLLKVKPGEQVSLTLEGGEIIKFKAAAIKLIDSEEAIEQRLGLKLQPLTPDLARVLNYPIAQAMIVSRPPNGQSEVKRGDILIRLGDVTIQNMKDVSRALQEYHYSDTVRMMLVTVQQLPGGHYRLGRKTVPLLIK